MSDELASDVLREVTTGAATFDDARVMTALSTNQSELPSPNLKPSSPDSSTYTMNVEAIVTPYSAQSLRAALGVVVDDRAEFPVHESVRHMSYSRFAAQFLPGAA